MSLLPSAVQEVVFGARLLQALAALAAGVSARLLSRLPPGRGPALLGDSGGPSFLHGLSCSNSRSYVSEPSPAAVLSVMLLPPSVTPCPWPALGRTGVP